MALELIGHVIKGIMEPVSGAQLKRMFIHRDAVKRLFC